MSLSESKTFYDNFAPEYEEYSNGKSAYLKSVENFVTKEAEGLDINSLVDIGAGDGSRTQRIAESLRVKHIVLMDNSERMLELSNNITNVSRLQIDIGKSKELAQEKFDVALCLWNVLGHVPSEDRLQAVQNIRRLTKSGGLIFIDVNNRYNITHYGFLSVLKNVAKDMWPFSRDKGDFTLEINTPSGIITTRVHLFSTPEIEKIFEKAKLKILAKKYIDYKTGTVSSNMFSGQLVYKLQAL